MDKVQTNTTESVEQEVSAESVVTEISVELIEQEAAPEPVEDAAAEPVEEPAETKTAAEPIEAEDPVTEPVVEEPSPEPAEAEAAPEPVASEEAVSEPVEAQVPPAPEKERYIGSVRFFKNLILLVVILAIAAPTTICFMQRQHLRHARHSAQQLQNALSALEVSMEEAAAARDLSETPENPTVEDPAAPEFLGEVPAYQELYPDFYSDKPLTGDQRTEGMIYLTFDDGPSARTPEILEVLREEDVKATFFVIGNQTEQGKQWMRDIVADGHTIAMHTYSHNYSKIYASVEAYLADMYEIFCLIKETTGETPSLFRFPGGSINDYNYGIYQELSAEMLRRGFLPCDWNISSQDAVGGSISAAQLTENVVSQASRVSRGVVLMHDSEAKRSTVASLPDTIRQLREQGFTFDRLTYETKPVLYGYRD